MDISIYISILSILITITEMAKNRNYYGLKIKKRQKSLLKLETY